MNQKVGKGGKKSGFHALLGDFPIPAWIHDRKTLVVLEMNRAAASLPGYKRPGLKKINLEDVFLEDEVPLLRLDLKRIRRKGRSPRLWHLRAKHGRLIVVELAFSPIDYDGRKAVLVLAHVESDPDVERRIPGACLQPGDFAHSHVSSELFRKILDEAENELRAAEEKYRVIFEKATVGIYQSTPDGRFLNVNPAMARIFGYESPQDMMENVTDIASQMYARPGLHEEFKNALREEGEIHEYIGENLRKDGRFIFTSTNARMVKDEAGNVLYYEGFITDITARKRAEEELISAKESLRLANIGLQQALEREQRVARTDGLTGLYNRRYFFELAEHEFIVAKRYKLPLSLILFDIANFKKFNDTYGHQVGDEILKRIAGLSLTELREADILSRYGGEEFMILLPNSSAREAAIVAERIRQSVAAGGLDAGGERLSVTVSAGVAEYTASIRTFERLVTMADRAMYAAKGRGRNCIVVYSPEVQD